MNRTAPAFPDDLLERWGVRTAEPVADTRSSHVYRVRIADGSSAIAKLLKPSGLHELPGMDFLAWRAGLGAAKLLDRHDTACLLEDAGRLTLRQYRHSQGEAAANAVIADLVKNLHAPSPEKSPAGLIPLERHFKSLFEGAAKTEASELSSVLRRCAKIAEALLQAQTNVRPLHGDLHHDNIVGDNGRGWLAIDPQGLLGDPAYDVANIFGNPDGAFAEIIEPARIMTLARLFSEILGCSEEKILLYAVAHAGLSVCWSMENGDTLSRGGNAFERFTFAKVVMPLVGEA
jgi:streptomycin 6-kinase